LAFLAFDFTGLSQKASGIRFIHIGEETKRIRTLVIDTAQCIQPKDRPLDYIFGKCIQTNQKTYLYAQKFISLQKYLVDSTKSYGIYSEFKIIVSSEIILYLQPNDAHYFFKELMVSLQNENLDEALIKVLKNYY
jgi:hypothetical protein